jgi:plastocyanin
MKKRLVRASIAMVALAAAAVPAALPAAHSARTVTVTLSEFRIKGVPKTLPQGATLFQVKNAGKFPHNLSTIFGPSASRFKTKTLQAGGTQSVTANLKPGAYILVCTVGAGFHASQGMIARFTVGKFDFTTGKWNA